MKLNLGGPPPAAPGSMEWLRQQKAAEAGGCGGGGGGKASIKDRGAKLGIPLGSPPDMSPRTPKAAAAPAVDAKNEAALLAEETATPKLSAHPTSARASRGKRKAATRRPRGKRGSGKAEPVHKAETSEQATTSAATKPRRSVGAAPTGALVLPKLDRTPKQLSAAPPGALVLPKLWLPGDIPKPEKAASDYFPRHRGAKAAENSKLHEKDAPAPSVTTSSPKPEFVPPEGIDPELTMMYELPSGDASEEIGLEALQKLVDSGEIGNATRVWCEPMEDCESGPSEISPNFGGARD